MAKLWCFTIYSHYTNWGSQSGSEECPLPIEAIKENKTTLQFTIVDHGQRT